MWLAVNAPERVDRLALCCTAPHSCLRQGLDRPRRGRAGRGMGAIADAVLGRWFRPSYREAHPDVVARFRAMLASTPAEGYAACCDALADADLASAACGDHGADPRADRLRRPRRAPADGDALAAAIPAHRHTVIEEAAHIANVEQPDAFTAALLRHLGGNQEDA